MDGVTLITPTSDRPLAFQLCQCWMKRAIRAIGGRPVQWIVVDDGHEPVCCTLGQLHLRREPSASPVASFRRNLHAALECVEHPAVLFIEDDDWYAADYLAVMTGWLENAAIVGEAESKYYNVAARRYLECRNREHASLCQTGIRSSLVPWLLDHLSQGETPFVDIDLWKVGAKDAPRFLRPQTSLCVGIKGLPGKTGLGVGHRLGEQHEHDPAGELLRTWIGGEDAEMYFRLFEEQARQ